MTGERMERISKASSISVDPSRKATIATTVRPDYVFLILAATTCFLLSFVTPPLDNPDEPAHLDRAWQISRGVLVPRGFVAQVPASLHDLAEAMLGDQPDSRHHSIAEQRAEWRRPLRPEITALVPIASSGVYSPLPYLPQALGVVLGRRWQLPPVGLMYAGRLLNAAAYIGLGFAALRLLPTLRWAACAVLCTPRALTLAASLSEDATLIGCSVLLVALLLRLCDREHPGGGFHRVTAVAAAVAIALAKPVYLPLLLIGLCLPRRVWGRHPWAWRIALALLPLAAAASWSLIDNPITAKQSAHSDPPAQLRWMAHHVPAFLGVITAGVVDETAGLIDDSISALGRGERHLPDTLFNDWIVFVLWLTVRDETGRPIERPTRAAAFIAVLLCHVGVMVSIYILWCTPGDLAVEGLQGRYLLPFALPALVVFRGPYPVLLKPLWIAGLIGLADWYTVWFTYQLLVR